jgi:hypothetical protein
VVILAGYADRMENVFSMKTGGRSRIAHRIDFPDYGLEQLLSIAETMLRKQNYRFSPAAREAMERYVEARREEPYFSNARSIRNGLDRARRRQAGRVFVKDSA